MKPTLSFIEEESIMNHRETIISNINELKDGEMKRVSIDDTDVLLSRINGNFYALGASCTHYGGPLELGILSGERIVCPWHHACFNAKTGDVLEPPAIDSLPQYEIRIEGDDIIIKLPEKVVDRRIPRMVKHDPQSDDRTFIIIGAGAAGNAAAQGLRENGFKGRLIMITYENRIPYDRPNLSKEYLQGKAEAEWMPLRSEEFFNDYGIELMRQKKVTHVDTSLKTILLDTGETLKYDKLLVATGGKARMFNVPGAELENIFTLRSYDDSDEIIKASESASRVTVVGASFIGMETAFSLTERKLPVTVIAPESVPFKHVFGEEIGRMFQKQQEENGVTFKLGVAVAKFEGDGKVEAVMLENGERSRADLVVVGIGVSPATDFLNGIDLEPDGSIKVNEYFCAAQDVYAAGDIARFPDWRTGEHIRIEHWRTAEQQGRIAAQNMIGKQMPYDSVPYFWTTQAGLNFRYVGHVKDWDNLIIKGDVSSQEFIAFYVKNNQILAAAGNKRDKEIAAIEELMRLKKMPAPEALRDNSVDLAEIIKRI
jgi:NADPH-dependent 2,4-dienoyl-CoA reductase/sulfur reductase-like enzyme/nitrite reductase/ring-hydroxylating ferredoxin subunit